MNVPVSLTTRSMITATNQLAPLSVFSVETGLYGVLIIFFIV